MHWMYEISDINRIVGGLELAKKPKGTKTKEKRNRNRPDSHIAHKSLNPTTS